MWRRAGLSDAEAVSNLPADARGAYRTTNTRLPDLRTFSQKIRSRILHCPKQWEFTLLTLLLVLLPWTGCGLLHLSGNQARGKVSYAPYESLLELIADVQGHLDDDIYRFGYPRDLTGQNLFKASIVRLVNYQRLYPDEFNDVIEMALAQCHERLGDYKEAIADYREVSRLSAAGAGKEAAALAKLAQERMAIAEEFRSAVNAEVNRESLSGYLADAEQRLQRLDALVERYHASGYEPLARLEREQAEVEYATVIGENRNVLPGGGGVEKAVAAYQRVIDENEESKNISAHRMRLADLYYELAAEYVALTPPERGEFEVAVFEGFLDRAIRGYYEVSRAAGYDERAEGQMKLGCALEFARRVREESK
jgi:tetratricopeptide (TPR) repeat protein